jgi:hypothetical protein
MATVKLVIPSAVKILERYAKPASTAFAFRTLLAPNEDNSSNTFVASTASTERCLGVLQTTVTSADADYASETKVPVLQDIAGVWEFAVGTGTADINDEQGYIDLKDADEVDVNASTFDPVFVTSFVSATKVLGKITRWAHLSNPAND